MPDDGYVTIAALQHSTELTVAAGKFKRLLDYVEQIGLDGGQVAAVVNLVPERIMRLADDQRLPALQYAKLYRAAVAQMQTLGHPIPWGAGVGTEAFELMCRCIISARTLGEALRVAERYERLLYPLLGYRMTLLDSGHSDIARLQYSVRVSQDESALAPAHWDRAEYQVTVAHASGLEVWWAFCGWLTGRPMEVEAVKVAAPYLNRAYHDSLASMFRCPVQFDADENALRFPRKVLDRRLVQTAESLAEFIDSSVYYLIAVDREPASTSAAIKSLVTIDLHRGLPTFAAVAKSLHMSESSLRRRLQREHTSYQALKDEVRCEVAIDHLLNRDAKVADLAQYLGFTEPSSFVRSFKNWTGQTPRNYRERMRALGRA